ncbi:hypothetical protein J4772_00445 [Cohnella sp. LGH]|uniref:S1 family peptidase n=1 Tax=Cohnella sp. LGH TaxID=1619153 RepID=UPI001ADC1B1A|nr:S1 family peptidase [Cohnella sp. LGH]QTH42999.1 hypothetical protein J4772_00445 [Cohnella sp. LGH]
MEQKAIENNVQLQKALEFNKSANDSYAGVYIDNEGILNVNVVGDVAKLKTLTAAEDIKYHQVKYTYAELEKGLLALQDKLAELSISQVGIDEIQNKLSIHVKELDDQKIQAISKYIDPEIADFQKTVGELVFTADILNGSGLDLGLTVGFGAKDASGNDGFVTAGHGVFSNGTAAKIGSNTVAHQSYTYFGAAVDAAFFKAYKGWWVWETDYYGSNKFTNGDTYSYALTDTANLIVGKTIYAYGAVSGKQTGTILAVNVTYDAQKPNGSTVTITNGVQANYKAIPGDSGAGVAYFRYTGSASADYAITGVQSASTLVGGAWVSGTSSSYFTRVDKIFATLNLSNL